MAIRTYVTWGNTIIGFTSSLLINRYKDSLPKFIAQHGYTIISNILSSIAEQYLSKKELAIDKSGITPDQLKQLSPILTKQQIEEIEKAKNMLFIPNSMDDYVKLAEHNKLKVIPTQFKNKDEFIAAVKNVKTALEGFIQKSNQSDCDAINAELNGAAIIGKDGKIHIDILFE